MHYFSNEFLKNQCLKIFKIFHSDYDKIELLKISNDVISVSL